jgi:hypothetical protein
VFYTYFSDRTSSQQRHRVKFTISHNLLRCLFLLYTDEEITFIHPDDLDLYNDWDSRAFELQVANHELLGHGSGKLFQEAADGSKNFDPEKVCVAYPERSRNFKLHTPDH